MTTTTNDTPPTPALMSHCLWVGCGWDDRGWMTNNNGDQQQTMGEGEGEGEERMTMMVFDGARTPTLMR
jgi:major membrane immunogen (membrane-anchored lipoprotein)